MKIYTRTGDKGQTSLYDGKRVDKNSTRVESYGSVDEMNSVLAVARQYCEDPKITEIIFNIQRKLFNVGGELSTTEVGKFPNAITDEDVKELEDIIDEYVELIGKKGGFQFIIPGSNHFSAHMHMACTVCRKSERRILTLADNEPVSAILMKYINRLSDALYALARYSETELHLVNFNE